MKSFAYFVTNDSQGVVTGIVQVTIHEAGSDQASALLCITVLGVNDAPVIDGAGPAGTITDKSTGTPFAGVALTEVDEHGLEALTVTVLP